MQRKRQFSGVAKPRAFFDRKVRVEGNTRIISLGKLIPQSWEYVRLKKISETDTMITIRIEMLVGGRKLDSGNKEL